MNTEIIKDENFEESYKEIIVPFCEKYEKSGFYDSFDGNKMHYLSYINENAKANILILHGFTESARKFDEMAYYFFNEGYSVFSPDLRGHAFSYKDEAPKYAVNSRSFDDYSKDIAAFIKDVIGDTELPLYCYSHSLGGTAALLTITDNLDIKIEKTVLSSPMICGNMGMPVVIASLVAKLLCKIGKGDMPAPGKCVFAPEKGNPDAASYQRGEHYLSIKKANEAYQTCGPTMNWVKASLEARNRILSPEGFSTLNSEMLVIKPEKDRQLLENWQDLFIHFCRKYNKSIEEIKTKNTCHEIYQSRETELKEYLENIIAFFEK